MAKLLVVDKDGTLVRPKSGNTFVQHPEDQELIEGVTEAIQRYVADGWTIAIASNQGGCEVRKCKVADFPVGAYYINGNDKSLMIIRKNQSTERILPSDYVDSFITLYTSEPRPNGKDYLYFSADSIVQFQYKTLDMAIAEMQYAMNLTGIRYGLFCPDMDGNIGWQVWAEDPDLYDPPFSDLKVSESMIANIRSVFPAYLLEGFRKPQNGMLVLASFCIAGLPDKWEQRLMIGDRPEDQGAAQAAGFDFMWAEDWRKTN
jgi:histidinol phosphatase-like enzyme